MYTSYAKELTRDYLKERGITFVSPLGNCIKRRNKYTGEEYEMNFYINNNGYYIVRLYETDRRMKVPKEERKSSTGDFYMTVHRIVYAWFNGIVHEGMVIDHINNNKLDNNIFNLQELTPTDNLNKNKVRRVVKCDLDKPRDVYQNLYDKYNDLYQEAKKNKDKDAQHKYRSARAYYEAKLSYYDQKKMEIYYEMKEKMDGFIE